MSDTSETKAGYPPLPENAATTPAAKPLLADGCYFLVFGVAEFVTSVGTMRVRTEGGQLFVSGDLYNKDSAPDDPPVGQVAPQGAGVPIFPIADYRYYLRVTKVEPADGGGFVMTFEVHQFIPKVFAPFDGANPSHWRFERTYTARMMPAEAPAGFPKPDMFFTGDVAGDVTGVFGQIQIGWISDVLRRASIRIAHVDGSEVPTDNQANVTWKSIFDPIGWDVTTVAGSGSITKKDDKPWTHMDAAAVFAQDADGTDLDSEWRYHILVVPVMAGGETHFGHMYVRGDRARTDLFMSSHFVFPETESQWGALRGQRNGTTVAFFRTALHEMGHEMGLEHNQTGFCFMRTTEAIAQAATAAAPFPANITWSFDPGDEHRLRHWPDIAVRPGGIDLGSPPDSVV